jgi:hypothetical protein
VRAGTIMVTIETEGIATERGRIARETHALTITVTLLRLQLLVVVSHPPMTLTGGTTLAMTPMAGNTSLLLTVHASLAMRIVLDMMTTSARGVTLRTGRQDVAEAGPTPSEEDAAGVVVTGIRVVVVVVEAPLMRQIQPPLAVMIVTRTTDASLLTMTGAAEGAIEIRAQRLVTPS